MLRRLPTAALLLAVLSVLAIVPGDSSRVPASPPTLSDEVLERARRVAAAWPGSESERIWRTGYYPELDMQFWLPKDLGSGDGAFAAFLAGRIDLAADLPPFSGTGTVSFPDGTSMTLPLTDPRSVYGWRTEHSGTCTTEPCDTRLTITAVRPATRSQLTSRGTATVPVWEFVFAGVEEPYTAVAVESQAPRTSYYVDDKDLPVGVTDVHFASEVPGGLDGTLFPGDCADAVPGNVVETAHVLVLIGRTTGLGPVECNSGSTLRSAWFPLPRPLGDRVVLNLAGNPLRYPTKD
ncbi:hypothetical protein ACFC26_00950 [Kitasatospora purpeofusca]|uniref:hypothetical protein n=1 Tax=Kitasatospora purpeofusca TaxID=67352 RepID=UPI0035D8DB81